MYRKRQKEDHTCGLHCAEFIFDRLGYEIPKTLRTELDVDTGPIKGKIRKLIPQSIKDFTAGVLPWKAKAVFEDYGFLTRSVTLFDRMWPSSRTVYFTLVDGFSHWVVIYKFSKKNKVCMYDPTCGPLKTSFKEAKDRFNYALEVSD